jgi:hypothetical protein
MYEESIAIFRGAGHRRRVERTDQHIYSRDYFHWGHHSEHDSHHALRYRSGDFYHDTFNFHHHADGNAVSHSDHSQRDGRLQHYDRHQSE